MKKDSAFVDHLLELLRPLGGVTARYMFGGWGIYKDGLMFSLVADGVFYLKTNDTNRPAFEQLGLPPWTYESPRGPMKMSYHRAPESALESSLVMVRWARDAFAAAQVSAKSKKPRRAAKSVRKRSKS